MALPDADAVSMMFSVRLSMFSSNKSSAGNLPPIVASFRKCSALGSVDAGGIGGNEVFPGNFIDGALDLFVELFHKIVIISRQSIYLHDRDVLWLG